MGLKEQTIEAKYTCHSTNRSKKFLLNKNQDLAEKILDFDKLLFQVLKKITRLSIDDLEKEIGEVLKIVVEYLDFDRGTLCEYFDEEDTLKEIAAYAQPGIRSQYTTNLSYRLSEHHRKSQNGEVILFTKKEVVSGKYHLDKKNAKAIQVISSTITGSDCWYIKWRVPALLSALTVLLKRPRCLKRSSVRCWNRKSIWSRNRRPK